MSAAGDFDYEAGGAGYALRRRPDPRIAAAILNALDGARTIVNVGAGAGSYEPPGRRVIAVEPSAAMRAQRPAGAGPAVAAVAEALPFADRAFDAAMATVTIHQWPDVDRGLAEMRRVAAGPVAVLTFDGEALNRFWLAGYIPELLAAERRRLQPIARVVAALGGRCEVRTIPLPADCTDGFIDAYFARPEALLDPAVRAAQSSWNFVPPEVQARAVDRLAADLASGAWDARHGHWRREQRFDGALRLIVAAPDA